jgi:hypothetical protein
MEEECAALPVRASAVWAKAQVVHEGPTRRGPTEPLVLLEEIAARPECHDGLQALLNDPRQLVVAYALVALRRMGSTALAELSDELFNRREQITLSCGSFRNSMDLGGLARQYRKEARGRAEPGASADRPHDR